MQKKKVVQPTVFVVLKPCKSGGNECGVDVEGSERERGSRTVPVRSDDDDREKEKVRRTTKRKRVRASQSRIVVGTQFLRFKDTNLTVPLRYSKVIAIS